MEYVPGTTLSDCLASGPLPEPEVIAVGVQIAAALEEAHENGVVHRDLKPGNIILTPKKQVKVLDFGLAKLFRPASATAVTESLTETQRIAGTLPYMAPEQLLGQAADARSDIWALGVVLYEMAGGVWPFQGQTGFELSSAILNQAPPSLSSHVPAELRALIERCLQKDPGRRYQQVGDVRAGLEAIQSGALAPWAGWY
jgi:serine/threonine protein kinase